MMKMTKSFTVAMALALVLSSLPPVAHSASPQAAPACESPLPDLPPSGQMASGDPFHIRSPFIMQSSLQVDPVISKGPFRTRVWLRHPRDLQRVRDLGATVLQSDESEAVVLVTADQLADLAWLGFRPHRTDSLDRLVLSYSASGILTPQFAELSPAMILAPAATDTDGDGLTDTEETWWCTDPGNPDSDSDLVNDGDEVTALVDWIQDPRSGRPSSGKPFIGWPPSHTGCYDDDYDSVPDLAETNMLGLNINLESTDRDKFDDGHELFGNTYCPGGAGACSYGYLPRDVDGGIVPPQMPTWVEAPGDHPMVATFPDPVIEVVEDSLQVDRVTTITTEEGGMTQETHTYESSVTRGTSTAVMNMQTWNDWQEVAASEPADLPMSRVSPIFLSSNGQLILNGMPKSLKTTGKVLGVVGAAGGAYCAISLAATAASGGTLGPAALVACAGFALVRLSSAGIGLVDTLMEEPEKAQTHVNVYSQSSTDNIQINNLQVAADNQRHTSESQDMAFGGGGTQYSVDESSQLVRQTTAESSAPVPQPQPTSTRSHGTAHGGAQSVTTTEYEEHTITEGYAFTTGENWSTAWTTDTVHAADLRFSYRVCNEGTDYAREITGLIFNVYLRGDANPIHTYNASAQIGTLNNVMPDECHTYTSDPIALTLDEMRAIDTGTNLYVVVEDYAFGNDELFYQDAINGGVVIGIEDGLDDGDELVDYYVIPTWGTETLQTVVQRYFPTVEDESGNLVSIYTPEFTTPPTFNEQALINNNWWNIYFSEGLDSSNGLSQTMSAPGTSMLFRMGFDGDYDGYNDRTEIRLGTDPDSMASYPHPELIAGYTVTRTGDIATVLMTFLNDGNYDAYGVEAVMFTPDDTVTVGNNTIGGGGRVNARQRVTLGPRVMDPGLSSWSGTAEPYATGHYTGTQDKVYTFVASDSGTIGSGTLGFTWNDGAGNNGTLDFGSVYHPPLSVDVAEGLQIGFDTGTVMVSDYFTFQVRLPRDTMTYTINSEPYTLPVIVVSYNDPQGNHRFITPVELDSLYDDLSDRTDEMLHDVGVDITTLESVNPEGPNTTYFAVNNPYPAPLEDAHVHINVADITGTVVARWSLTETLPSGPTVISDTWETSVFTEPYQADRDYLMLAFWTDYQGNIVDTAGRMLSSFQADPQPALAMTDVDATWDMGLLYEGETAYRNLTMANVGHSDLLLGALPPARMPSVARLPGRLPLVDSVTAGYLVDATTPGSLDGDLYIRTNDLESPVSTIHVVGMVEALPDLKVGLGDVAFDDDTPSPGQSLTITTTVHNKGDGTAYDVLVRFYDGDPRLGNTQIGSDQTITSIASGSTQIAQTSWTYQDGINTIFAQIDSLDTIPERDEMNNITLGFLNVSTALPPDGVIDGQTVLLVTEPSGLTESTVLTITDEATLVMRDVTATIESIALDNSGALLMDNANLTLASLQSTDGSTGQYLRALSSTMSSQSYFSVAVGILEAISTTVQIVASDGANGESGEFATGGDPGGSAIVSVAAEAEILLRDVDVVAEGGRGGDGGGGGAGGGGGVGGSAEVYLDSLTAIGIEDVAFDIRGGQGGSGGTAHSPGTGGTGGQSSLAVASMSLNLHGSAVSASGGIGGNGGNGTQDYSTGGHGGQGGGSVAEFTVTDLSMSGNSLTMSGGDGGQRGAPLVWRQGGNGGGGGNASGVISATNSIVSNIALTTTGGIGQSGGGGIGGAGGQGGSTNMQLVADQLQVSDVQVSSIAGGGGDSAGYWWGGHGIPGGGGGSAVQQITAGGVVGGRLRADATGGDGGKGGGCTDRIGGDGGDGGSCTQDWQSQLAFEANFDTLECNVGSGGVGGSGSSPGSPGVTGAREQWLLDGYAGSRLAEAEFTLSDLRPNLLSLSGVDVITTTWDEALTTSLPVPYILTAPQDAGFHRLDVYYHLFDGSTTQSTHWVYIYQDTINDYDGDGLSDFDEVTEYATEPVIADTDNDGLNDGDEAAARTDPLNPDSDYDDIPDGQDSDALFYSDLTPDPAGPAFNKVWPTEGTIITVSATISDVGSHDAKGVVVAFFDGDPEGDGSYICADFITSVPTTTSALAECVWDTTGVTGTREIYVVADPVDRIVEEDENNNSAHSSLTILTKPDLWIASLTPAETEVVEGQSITVTAVVQNSGQTDAPTSTLALYQGTTMNGTLVHSATVAVSAGEAVTAPLPWTATALGPQSLTSRADLDDDVDESREDNNDTHTDVYVGWGSPIYVDAGGDPDPVYSPSLAYGLLSENTTVIDTCGDAPYQTYRQGVYGEPLEYRFDHLLPSHYYHLDTTYSVCGGQRVEHLWVDSGQVGGPLTVTASAPVCHSTLVDPAVYGDHSIVVGVTASGLAAPAVAELGVNDIYHCYRDSGSAAGDPPYAPGIQCGYYDPLTQGSDLWGSMPVQTVRFDPNDSDVVYRFSGLEFTKRYVAHLRLYEGDGTGRQETVRVDGVTVGPTVTLSSEPQVLVVDIPPEAYEGDGIVDVAVVETTGWNVPVVSEIAVEEVTLAIPTAAQLVAPATGHTISDTTPTFAWDAAHGASAYRLQVDEDPGFGSPEIDESTASASYTPTVPLDFGTYHWRVRASNGCGDGPWSLVWSVTITNSAPSLSGLPNIVFDHSTGPTSTVDLWAYTWDAATPVDQLSYVISGTPPSGAGLTLADNRTVHVEPSAAWCGYTDVTIRATDPEGLWDEDTFRVAVTWSCQGPLPVPSRAAAQDEPITLDLTPYEPQVGDGTGLVWYATEEERCAVSGEYSEDDVLTFTPEAGFLGNDAVTLHMVYPWGSEATQELMLTWDSAPPMELELYLPVVTRDCP